MHDLFVKDPIKEWDDWSKRLVVHTRGIKSRIGESLYLASPMVLFLSNVFFLTLRFQSSVYIVVTGTSLISSN